MKSKYPNQRYTINDEILSKYILNLSSNGNPIPYMTKISVDTGVSAATISRWAKRRGYYSFAELRASFNKDNKGFDELIIVLANLFESIEKCAIVYSKFTEPVAILIKNKLQDIGVTTRYVGQDCTLQEDETVIATSLSGYSKQIGDFVKNNPKAEINLLTTNPDSWKNEKVKLHIFSKMKYSDDVLFEGYKVLRQLYEMVDDSLNIVYIRKKK